MAPKKAPINEQAALAVGDMELDQAIDDLRGVLKKDTDAPAGFGAEFGSVDTLSGAGEFGGEFAAPADGLGAFGGDFGSDTFGNDLSETPATTDFGGGSFGASDFGASDFDAGETVTDTPPGSGMTANLDLIMDIPIDVQIVLGTSRMQVSGLMNLTEGATISLDRRIGEPVEIMVNGRIIGRGEITVLEGDDTRFGVKLIEIKGSKKS
ncbi:flagellar motor switch protein FliN [Ensifer sp. T173]|jgi:flagellar motor switch protein FliN/FliY|uniref:Flagellar motor switch protein FliN n=1 Tax=Ensifer canadensis TaxID=555315 RepID=A0AAW4FJ19_9HYPH|nr:MULTISPECIES: flagellar motor switch protein FliN [Ensifer]KQW84881.1 flagellar motor switch protein FliN [Ensifer sp. Root127]MBD9486152.1 flagellar motor switch protein FliN [Ensifer sp. ENS11]MBM3091096.1 flagellar motor switch protein FliN [Ensifer canadensis]PSS66966.1 flagellar motor switch protein FliN [Ensifer sp. NM-2]UBI75849.1 flagellar motor switch protein FliN [Ensifer canadensis]